MLWIGDAQPSPAEPAAGLVETICALIGAAILPNGDSSSLGWFVSQPEVQSLLEQRHDQGGLATFRLKMPGWQRYEELKRAVVNSRVAFMAMEYGHADLDGIVRDHFRPAVARTGFTLKDMRDDQPAGVIDDQMRVALRTSRFVIADLTHSNRGAYWESGFAEGLGRPVIYTCEKAVWDREKTHFDTNHLVTIPWSIDDPATAAEKLVSTIRATLPVEAKLAD